MWSADVHLDPEWISQYWPTAPRVVIPIKFESYPKADISLLIYGDDFDIKHIRLKTNFCTKKQIEKFVSEKRTTIMNSISVFSGLVCGRMVKFGRFGGHTKDIVSFFKGGGIPLQIKETLTPAGIFDYSAFSQAMSCQFPGFEPYCFYLKMASDITLPLDYRWLNFYRILETRYNPGGKRGGLKHNIEFQNSIKKLNCVEFGTIEKIRGSIHAFARGGTPGIGQYDSKYPKAMESSLHCMHLLVIDAIDTHPDNPGFKLVVRQPSTKGSGFES